MKAFLNQRDLEWAEEVLHHPCGNREEDPGLRQQFPMRKNVKSWICLVELIMLKKYEIFAWKVFSYNKFKNYTVLYNIRTRMLASAFREHSI